MLGARIHEGGTTEVVLSGLHVKVQESARRRRSRGGLTPLHEILLGAGIHEGGATEVVLSGLHVKVQESARRRRSWSGLTPPAH